MDKKNTIPWSGLLKIASLPLCLYLVYFAIRVTGSQPEAESGIGEFITAVYFIFGASVNYFIFILYQSPALRGNSAESTWWWASSVFLAYLAFDEIFMLHENLSAILDIKELFIFIVYAVLLLVLVYIRKAALNLVSMVFFAMFVLFSGISVIADSLFREGLVNIFGIEVGYEQLAETVAALALSAMFVSLAYVKLKIIDTAPVK